MNYLGYLASNDDLSKFALEIFPKQYQIESLYNWLLHWGQLHYYLNGKNEIINGLRNENCFNTYQFLSGYPDICKNIDINNTNIAYYVWIVYNNLHSLKKNLYNLSEKNAQFLCNLHNSNILIVGNSVKMIENLKQVDVHSHNIVIGFNKILNNCDNLNLNFNYVLCNYVIYNLMCPKINNNNIICINDLNVEHDILSFEPTTGLLTLLWIFKFAKFNKVTIVGFNMVNPGERAHFFDDESPSRASETFKGHNANYERNFLQNISNYDNVEVIF